MFRKILKDGMEFTVEKLFGERKFSFFTFPASFFILYKSKKISFPEIFERISNLKKFIFKLSNTFH